MHSGTGTTTAWTRREAALLALLLGLGAALQTAFALYYSYDPDEFDLLHQLWLHRQGWRPFTDYLAARPWPALVLLSPLLRLLGEHHVWLYRLALIGVATGNAFLLYWMIRRGTGVRAAALSLLLYQTATVSCSTNSQIRVDQLMFFFLLLTLLFLERWLEREKMSLLLLTAACAALSFAFKPTQWPVVVLAGLAVVETGWRSGGSRRWWPALRLGLIFSAVFLLTVAATFLNLGVPWGARLFLTVGWFGKLATIVSALQIPFQTTLDLVFFYDLHLFLLLPVALAHVLWRRFRGAPWNAVSIMILSLPLYAVALYMKRQAHGQDALYVVLAMALWGGVALDGFFQWLGEITGGAPPAAGEASRARRAAFFLALTPRVAKFAAAAGLAGLLLGEGLFSGLAYSRDLFWNSWQPNAFVAGDRFQSCGEGPTLTIDRVLACFKDPLWFDFYNMRLTRRQEEAAVDFYNRVAGPKDLCLSSDAANIFRPNSHNFSPPRLQVVVELIDIYYADIHRGVLGDVAKMIYEISDGKLFIFSGIESDFRKLLRKEFIEENQPAVIGLDRVTLELYTRYDFLKNQLHGAYRVVYDLDSASLFAINVNRCPECLERALAKKISPNDKLVRQAKTLLKSDNLSAAEAMLRLALQNDPGHLEANRMLGELLLRRGKARTAVAPLEQAAESSYFRDLDAVVALCEAYVAAGAREKAHRLFEERVLPTYDARGGQFPVPGDKLLCLRDRDAYVARARRVWQEIYGKPQ